MSSIKRGLMNLILLKFILLNHIILSTKNNNIENLSKTICLKINTKIRN